MKFHKSLVTNTSQEKFVEKSWSIKDKTKKVNACVNLMIDQNQLLERAALLVMSQSRVI